MPSNISNRHSLFKIDNKTLARFAAYQDPEPGFDNAFRDIVVPWLELINDTIASISTLLPACVLFLAHILNVVRDELSEDPTLILAGLAFCLGSFYAYQNIRSLINTVAFTGLCMMSFTYASTDEKGNTAIGKGSTTVPSSHHVWPLKSILI